ncbi:hypothetical protein ACHQM5_002063 [Ranunculus cassubicifolius]
MNGQKTVPEVGIQMPTPEGKVSLDGKYCRKADLARAFLRLLCLLSSVIAVSFMVTSEQSATISVYGFNLPVFSKWSFSSSFEYLVGISAAAAGHSLLQLVVSVVKLVNKTPVFPSRHHAWLVFACDQIFAYALMSAGAAASGVTNLNRTGIKHSALPNFCKPLRHFCDQVAVSITFTFFSCFLAATSTVLDVIWLSKN